VAFTPTVGVADALIGVGKRGVGTDAPLAVSVGAFSDAAGAGIGALGIGAEGNGGSTIAFFPTNAAANEPSVAAVTPALAADA
jgi:hypothetical protein